MWADAHAARRCRLRRPASQPLWSCQKYSLNQKATPKRLRQQLASGTSESDALLQPKAASAWSVFFFPNVSKNTCKHPPPNTRYISSADFSKTAVVKNNPMKKTIQLKKREVRVSCTSPAFHLTAVRKRELQRDSLFLPG